MTDDVLAAAASPGGALLLEEEQLSSDLTLFLSNPSLTKSLSDGSLDLASYSQVVSDDLARLESECIEIYHAKSSDIDTLRSEMDACDHVLASLQEMLLGFQADLGGLSGDIRLLQEQSHTLEVQLRNRKRAEAGLRRFLERIVVPPNLADVVCNGAVDSTFVDCVRELNEKHAYVTGAAAAGGLGGGAAAAAAGAGGRNKLSRAGGTTSRRRLLADLAEEEAAAPAPSPSPDLPPPSDELLIAGVSPRSTHAGREMAVHIETLRLRAVQRTREYFLARIGELRRPKVNVRMIQVNALLKYADLNDFLAQAAPEVYSEVRDVYVESMGRTLVALFRTYQAQLARLDSNIANRHDLIAVEEAALRDAFSTKVNLTKRGDTFFLGDRAVVLDLVRDNARPILAHEALAAGVRYPYEMIFRSVMTHLMDSATNEYVFAHQFFRAGGVGVGGGGGETFQLIFARTLSLVLEQLENYLFNCYDCLALLLMIKLTHACRRIMRSRRVPVLDNFFERVTMLLWPRLKMVVDAQLRGLRLASAAKLGGVELHAHYVSRRYAEFTSSILLILNRGRKQSQGQQGGQGQGGGSGAGAAAGSTSPPTGMSRKTTGGSTGAAAGGSRRHRRDQSGASSNLDDPLAGGAAASISPPHRGISRAQSSGSMVGSAASVASGSHASVAPQRGSAGDMLMGDLALVTTETVNLLERLADEHITNKKRIVFLINNYDQVLTTFQERRITGREMQTFADLLATQRELFVEEELLQSYSRMIAFVHQTESAAANMARGERLERIVNERVVEDLVREFSHSWRGGIEQINRNVLSYFSNFRNGMEILKQVLTQLLLYYTRFQDIIRKTWRAKPPAWCKDLVSTTVILAEIKKYALSI